MASNLEGDQIMARRLNAHLKKTEIKTLKNKLLAEEERIVNKQLSKKIEFKLNSRSENKDDVDSANDNILVSTDLRFSNRELLYLKKIRKAITKTDSEEYGMCIECGDEINFSRLFARPTSDLCILCKEESERAENQSSHGKTSKSLGETMSMTSSL